MVKTLESLANDALALPENQRLALAHRLLSCMDPPCTPGVDALWEQEIARRIALLDSGATGIHVKSEVFAELERRLGS